MFLGISMLALSSVEGYHGYVLFAWMYGLCLGGFLYSMKMLTMERVRGRHFSKVWGKCFIGYSFMAMTISKGFVTFVASSG